MPEIPGALAESQIDSADGHTHGDADVSTYVADIHAAPGDEKGGRTDQSAVDLSAVAEAIACADQPRSTAGRLTPICGQWPNSPLRCGLRIREHGQRRGPATSLRLVV